MHIIYFPYYHCSSLCLRVHVYACAVYVCVFACVCVCVCVCVYGCSMEQVNNLREVQALRRLNPHPNVIELKEVVL